MAELTDAELAQLEVDVHAAHDFTSDKLDEILEDAADESIDFDDVFYALWMFSTRYLAEAGWSAERLHNDLADFVAHQTSEGEA